MQTIVANFHFYRIYFILKVFAFLLPLIASLFYIEVSIKNTPNIFLFKRSNLERQLKDIEILVVGNSETQYGINPTFLKKKTFNLSQSGEHIIFTSDLLKKYVDQMPKLKFIILSNSYFSFYRDRNFKIDENQLVAYNYYHYWEVNSANISSFDVNKYMVCLYSSNVFLENLFHDKNYYIQNQYRNGWVSFNNTDWGSLTSRSAKAIIKEHEKIMDENALNKNIEVYKSLLNFCKKRKIHLFIISMPKHRLYVKVMNPIYVKRNEIIINTLFKKSSSVKYIDYTNDLRFVDTDFYNLNHLNKEGAKKLSKIINDEGIIQ